MLNMTSDTKASFRLTGIRYKKKNDACLLTKTLLGQCDVNVRISNRIIHVFESESRQEIRSELKDLYTS